MKPSSKSSKPAGVLQQVRHLLFSQFRLDDDQADYTQIDSSIRSGVRMRGTNLWVLMFAILVASIGLNVNSTAVIIGAMLISPLMGPIMGVGYGVAIYDFELVRRALKALGMAILISLIASTLYFTVTPLSEAGSELLARTSPTIWDVLIALFGGLAGIIGATRAEKNNTVPGVAIATALMPPLCTASYGIATGNIYYFLGAFYLFFINAMFIAIATFLMVTVINPPHRQFVDAKVEARVKRIVGMLAIATLVPSVYLAVNLVSEEVFKSNANKFVRQEFLLPNVHVADTQFDARNKEVEVSLIGSPLNAAQLAQIKERMPIYQLGQAQLRVHQSRDASDEVVSLKATLNHDLSSLRTNLLNDLYKNTQTQLIEKDTQITAMQSRIKSFEGVQGEQRQIAQELMAQYPQLQTAALSVMQSWSAGSDKPQPVLVVRVTTKKMLKAPERRQIVAWLKVRAKVDQVSVLEDR